MKPAPLFCSVVFSAILFQILIINAEGTDRVLNYNVPSSAVPGYIITVLSHENSDTSYWIESSSIGNDVHKYISVLNHNTLVTASNLTTLQGKTFSILLLVASPTGQWKETIDIFVGNSVHTHRFNRNTYFGIIAENEPIGSSVSGLHDLVKLTQSFPQSCQFKLELGDVDSFTVSRNSLQSMDVTSLTVLDRELKALYYVIIQSECPQESASYAMIHIEVSDVNDNVPEFGNDIYTVTLKIEEIPRNSKILQVEAFDADYGNDIKYSLFGTDVFTIHPKLGSITIPNPQLLTRGTSYEFQVIATDQDEQSSNPATVRVIVKDIPLKPFHYDEEIDEFEDEIVYIEKRALKDDRIFVVRGTQYNDLFTVASVPPVAEERFEFADPAPQGLTLDEESGMVTRESGHTWNSTMEIFFVNISRTDDPEFEDEMQVIVYITSAPWEEPIFRNEPTPLWARVPIWIRPYTSIYKMNSTIADTYNAPVQYQLESGGDDRFSVDPVTGDVKIAWRGEFVAGEVYTLAISAQSLGTAPRIDTPSQVVHVKVEDITPQFYQQPYIINISETSEAGDSVAVIRVVSFQELSIIFSWEFDNEDDAALFSLNSDTGEVTLLQKLVYIHLDRVQYRMRARATEDISNLFSEVEVIINLVAENLHQPFFPPTHYIKVNLTENVADDIELLNVIGVDLDPGNLGLMDFTSLHPNFTINTADGKIGTLFPSGGLDYDFIGPEHKYEFLIMATDKDPVNPKSGSTTVQIWMSNVNDEAPVFFPEEQVVNLFETTDASIEFIHYVQAHDPDGDGITFKFVVAECTESGATDTTCGIFDLDPNTGQIRLNAQIPQNSPNQVLVIEVTDDGTCCPDPNPPTFTTRGSVTINYVGVNHPPFFPDCDSYFDTSSINEGAPANTPIVNVTGNDTDSGENGQVTFSVKSDASIPDYFDITQIGPYKAELYSLREFDREDPETGAIMVDDEINYGVTVVVTDRGQPPLSSTCFFLVGIDDVNDNSPIFDANYYEVTISTTPARGDEILRVWAIDDDDGRNADVTYSIIDHTDNCTGDVECFLINPNTGWIAVDVDSIPNTITQTSLTIRATDNGIIPNYNDVQVFITLTDDNLPPLWEDINGQKIDDVMVTIPENTTIGTRLEIFLQAAIDGAAVTYYLVNGRTKAENSDRDFQGTPSPIGDNFDIVVGGNLDNTEESLYLLKLRASRTSSLTRYTDARLQVNVTDVNDKIPYFVGMIEVGKYEAAVSEETEAGDHIITVKAIDLDRTSPNNKVLYKFADDCGDCSEFSIEEDTGRILATKTYDRAIPEYILNVIAEDGAASSWPHLGGEPNSDQAVVYIDVLGPSEAPPFFPEDGDYDRTIDEGQQMYTNVVNVTAEDPDPNFNYPQYIISRGDENHRFAVMRSTGRIYSTGDLLYSQQKAYNLTYNVFDGGNIDTTYVLINLTSINMYPPSFVDTIYENNEYTETQINQIPAFLVQAHATDKDAGIRGGVITYDVEGAFVQNDNFLPSPNGSIYLNNPNLDRDYPNGHANWQINIVASDEDPLGTPRKGYAILDVLLKDINDNTPFFNVCCIEGYIEENSPPVTSVLQLSAIDYDFGENSTIEYTAIEIPEDNGTPIFDMGIDGLIVTTSYNLDRESRDSYTMVVIASDKGPEPRVSENQTIYITVTDDNDNSPYFEPQSYIFDMPEEIPIGGSVNYVQGVDIDIGDNAKLTFEVTGGSDSNYFYMDSIYVAKTGTIKIQQVIDYESLQDKTLQIEVSVSDPDNIRTDIADVTINVLDINDNAPEFQPSQQNVSIKEHEPLGTFVATFTASDVDTGLNANFSYYIDYENTDQEKKFSIGPNSGVVTVRNDLDREIQPSYAVHILAIDEGVPAMTGTATLYVTLLDINDHAPNFPPGLPPLVVGSGTSQGSVVLDFTAIDLDEPNNGPPFIIDYCNDPGCDHFGFQQTNDTSGSLTANLNGYNRVALQRKYYDLRFTMTDNPTTSEPQMSAIRVLRVTIESLNDHEMIQDGSVKTVVVYNYMRQFKNVHCGNVYVNDEDDWDLPDKTFTCVDGCQLEVEGTMEYYFNVTSDLGQIYMLEGTPKGDHKLSVQVFDRHWDQTITAIVNVKVIYIEQNAVLSSGSMRLQDITSEDFIVRTNAEPISRVELFHETLAALLEVDKSNVDIFTIQDVPDEERMVDVQFSAYGLPYYAPVKLSGIVWANKAQIETAANIDISSAPVDECMLETCYDGGCTNRMLSNVQPVLVNTNATSYVGINTTFEFECACKSALYDESPPTCDTYSCLNGGICTENWNGFTCECMEGFEGKRCQNTKVSFDGVSWAWFESLGSSQCSDFRLSLEFITTEADGLILFNGPMTNLNDPPGLTDYISIELEGSKAKARIDLGDGEVEMKVDGTDSKTLSDGNWHTIEIIKEFKTVRLIVDHCDNSVVDETVNTTSQDRTPCEASATLTGDQFLLNVFTPLELGGRSKPSVDYPVGITAAGFDGCIKNLMYVDTLYDLELSRTQTSGNPSNGCDRESGCLSNANLPCPPYSTCVGNLNNDDKLCVCHIGLIGDGCDTDRNKRSIHNKQNVVRETSVKDFEDIPSFVEWELTDAFNATLDPKALAIWLKFRTRTGSGILFTASSFSDLEHMKIEVIDTHLQVRYDFGSDDRDVQLTYVNVSDGLWHDTYVTRYGNQVILRLDHGEGKYFNTSIPNDDHQLLYVSDVRQTYGGADVHYKKYHSTPVVTNMMVASCVSDYRINHVNYFPLDDNDDQSAAILVQDPGVVDGCTSDACDNVVCPSPQNCTDRWRMPYCICPPGQINDPTFVCIPIMDCSIPRCAFGDCVTVDGLWRCNCYPGYYGEICDQVSPVVQDVNVTLSTGAIIAILLCLLILLLLLLIVLCLQQKKQQDQLLLDPNDETRENVIYYDEEGAGEEDMYAYDLSRLQKPVGHAEIMATAGAPNTYSSYSEDALLGAAPEPMSEPKRRYIPGANGGPSNVGAFIGDQIIEADIDPNVPPYDSVREYEYEGDGSSVGSLSSIESSSSGDLNFDNLVSYGPKFQKLADMYGIGEEDEEPITPSEHHAVVTSSVNHVPVVEASMNASGNQSPGAVYVNGVSADASRRQSQAEVYENQASADAYGSQSQDAVYVNQASADAYGSQSQAAAYANQAAAYANQASSDAYGNQSQATAYANQASVNAYGNQPLSNQNHGSSYVYRNHSTVETYGSQSPTTASTNQESADGYGSRGSVDVYKNQSIVETYGSQSPTAISTNQASANVYGSQSPTAVSLNHTSTDAYSSQSPNAISVNQASANTYGSQSPNAVYGDETTFNTVEQYGSQSPKAIYENQGSNQMYGNPAYEKHVSVTTYSNQGFQPDADVDPSSFATSEKQAGSHSQTHSHTETRVTFVRTSTKTQ